MSGGAPMLEFTNLTRRFQGLVAVDAVSSHVDAHELVGLIGPNGAGKTTLFNLISGFIPPTEGDIRFEGRSIVGMRPHRIARLGIGRTFQNLRIDPRPPGVFAADQRADSRGVGRGAPVRMGGRTSGPAVLDSYLGTTG
jgi:ABC-type dipeptide/oligopeptide/nickel transport system ATPase component